MASQDEFEIATQKFLEWLPTMGITMSPKMQLVDLRSDGRGRGVVATGEFEEDEVIFSIPRRSVISLRTTTDTYACASIDADITKLPSWLTLTAIIVGQGKQDSQWHPYFEVLPNKLDTLIFWSEDELKELQASTVVQKIGRAGAEAEFNKHLIPAHYDLDLCHRAASTIMAYAFDIPEDERTKRSPIVKKSQDDDLESDDEDDENTILSMVPLADMLNADADRNNARLFYDAEELEMRAIKPIAKGEEIFNDYGQLPRADLLRRYGYITHNYAPFDVAELSTQEILDAVTGTTLQELDSSLQPLTNSQLKRRVEIAEREGVYEDSFDVYHSSSEQTAIPDELVAFIFLLLVNKDTFDAIHSSQIAIPSRSKLTTELVGKVLVHLLKAREAEYATRLEEDEAFLKDESLPYRKKMAVQVRLGEKKVLRGAIMEAETFHRDNKQMRITQEVDAAAEKTNGKRKAEPQMTNSRKKGRK